MAIASKSLCPCPLLDPLDNPFRLNVENISGIVSITNITVGDIVPAELIFPIEGFTQQQTLIQGGTLVIIITLVGPESGTQCVQIEDSNGSIQCQQYVASGNYTFTNVVSTSPDPVLVQLIGDSCTC